MGIRVSEHFVEAKFAERVCEDVIVVTDHFAAVIDGASDATGLSIDGKTGGRFAAEVIERAIHELAPDADARVFADTLAAALSSAVTASIGEVGDDIRWPVAVVACASAHRREVWRIGDCNVVVDGRTFPGMSRVGDATGRFRAAVNAALMAKGLSRSEVLASDPGAKAARALIDIQQHLTNVVGPWGFGCVNGRRVPDEYIEIMSLPEGPTEVILASDGFPVLLPTLQQSEIALADLIQRDPAAIDELWAISKSTRPGANAPDDRAYLRLVVD